MTFAIDQSLPWTDHYAKHGFAVVKNIVTPEFCERTIKAIQKALGTDLERVSATECPQIGVLDQVIGITRRPCERTGKTRDILEARQRGALKLRLRARRRAFPVFGVQPRSPQRCPLGAPIPRRCLSQGKGIRLPPKQFPAVW